MAATILDIADALVDGLNGATFSPPYDRPIGAVRSYATRYSPEQLERLRVTVIPGATAPELYAREVAVADFQIGVAVQRRTDWTEENQRHEQLDALGLLTQEIVSFCLGQDALAGACCTAVDVQVPYDADLLRDDGTYTAVLACTFKAEVEVTP